MRNSKRIEEAKKKAREVFDQILEVYPCEKCVEIVARVGGDIVIRRYYDNGMEVDK